MMDVKDLTGLNESEIIDLLLDQGVQLFVLTVPKLSREGHSSNNDIAFDYLCAACAGQEIFEASEEFSYESVPPSESRNLSFEFRSSDLTSLAERLKSVSDIYNSEDPMQDELVLDSINSLLDRIRDGLVPACGELIEYYMDFSMADD